tara:strand:+ start:180 stop:401 length:222 start_codon:yes stop_codon:yes gene_type:complete
LADQFETLIIIKIIIIIVVVVVVVVVLVKEIGTSKLMWRVIGFQQFRNFSLPVDSPLGKYRWHMSYVVRVILQ